VVIVLRKINTNMLGNERRFLRRLYRRIRYLIFSLREIYNWDYESCDNCGIGFKVAYHLKDETWIKIYGSDDGCLCLNCLIEVAMRKKIPITKDDFTWLSVFEEVIDEGFYCNNIINKLQS